MNSCQDDSCDLVHCGHCGCHTAGNTLMVGLCSDCWLLDQEAQDRWNREWRANQLQDLKREGFNEC